MAAHVTAASVRDFKLFSYFFALFFFLKNIFRYIDACAFKIYYFQMLLVKKHGYK
jgi:hypothetical protein